MAGRNPGARIIVVGRNPVPQHSVPRRLTLSVSQHLRPTVTSSLPTTAPTATGAIVTTLLTVFSAPMPPARHIPTITTALAIAGTRTALILLSWASTQTTASRA